MVRVTSALFPMDSTLCIIKPDAMRLGYKDTICHMIHMFGFNVIAEGRFKVRTLSFYPWILDCHLNKCSRWHVYSFDSEMFASPVSFVGTFIHTSKQFATFLHRRYFLCH